ESRFRAVFPSMPPLCFPNVSAADLARCEYEWWRELVQRVFAAAPFVDFNAFFRELFDYFARASSWELFADVQPAFAALRESGLRLAIVSNFDARLFGICDGLGITAYFDAIVVSSRVGCAKPDPRIFALALDRLHVTAGEAMHVGDSGHEDIAGARAAGIAA